jgi:uroporphyrinogen decarboxylase
MVSVAEDRPLLLRALAGEDTARAPMWLMRQAGRYLPEYMAVKAKASFLEMVQTPSLAAEVTLQPLRRFDLDAAIVFADIMTPLPSMGVPVTFNPGPVVEPLRTAAAVEALRIPDGDEIAPYLCETLKLVRTELATKNVPLIGFGGAPLTLAAYLIQGSGSKEFEEFRGFLRREPSTAHALLNTLTEVSIRYLRAQVNAGAQVIQLFDSWAGLHDEDTYRTFGLPYHRRVLAAIEGVPRIFLAVGAGHLLGCIAELPCEGVSVDWRTSLSVIRSRLPGRTMQGNLDPAALLGDATSLTREANAVLRAGVGGPHIFNLGHGVFRQTAPEQVARLVDVVGGFDRHAGRR